MKLRELFFPYDHRPEHNKALDGLRGWAVLLVLFGHATNQGLSPWLDGYFLSRGKLGVYLFFIISAYLLDKQIIQVWQQGKGNWNYWRYYIGRRIMRIFPPFVLALITFRLMNEAGYKVVIREWSHVWEHLALMRGDHIFWSIPTEFRYYLISPLLLWLCLRLFKLQGNHTVRFFTAIILATLLINHFNELPRHSTLRYLGIFAIGTLIAAFETLYQEKFQQIIQSNWLTNLFIVALGVFIGWGWASDDFTQSNVYIPAAILWGILLLASFQEGVWRGFLSLRPFRFIGAISYSLYLFHIPILMWVKSLGLSNAVALPAFLSLSIAVAALLHLLVERPALSLVKKKALDPTLTNTDLMDTTQRTSALRTAVANGQTYEAYSAMNKDMAKEGTTTGPQKPSYVEYTKLSAARMRRWEKTYKPSQGTLDNIVSRTSEKEQWLVFSETWCGDAAHNLPFIAKWAEHAGVDLRIILRDENTALMDEFLTNGGRSIPKLVRLNEHFEVLGTWGPRPTPLMEQYAKWKAEPEFDYKEWTLFAQDWYNKDKGASLEADLTALLG